MRNSAQCWREIQRPRRVPAELQQRPVVERRQNECRYYHARVTLVPTTISTPAQAITTHAQLTSSVLSAAYYTLLDSVPKTNERMLLTTVVNSLLRQKYGVKSTPITGECVKVLSLDMCFSENARNSLPVTIELSLT